MADNSLNILIVDDHDIVLRGMHHLLLDIMGEGCRVDCSSTAAKALLLAAANHYNLCLLDIELPDSPGIDLVNRLRQASPGMKIIVNTIHEELWLVKEYFDANVEGILFKDVLSSEIVTAVNRVIDGESYYCRRAEQLRRILETSEIPTPKELEVLRRLATGMTSDDIAAEMGLSPNTIETHRRHLLDKLNARNSAELVLNAVNHGLLPIMGQ